MSLPPLPGPLAQAFAIGLKPLDPSQWIDVDDELAAYLAEKGRLFAKRRAEVFAAEYGTGVAQQEVLQRLVAHLAQHSASHVREDNAVRIVPTGEVVALDGDRPALETAARLVQEDFVLMRRSADGWRLVAAALCFPSAWRLSDKFGRPMHEVHAPVPGFGAGTRPAELINRMFDNLQTGAAMLRWNWSLFGDRVLFHPEPSHAVPRFGAEGEKAVVRLERQTITKLDTGDVLFTIRIYLEPIDSLARQPEGREIAAAIRAQLAAMPVEQAEYKGLLAERETVMRRLEGMLG
ncbi:heme-dependent oxidative N-demethylase family protein [Devosia sp. CN2-171]|uniref:heme-dependent oxidative N-demethylase family protein n=1 Tax=Devosia sp. CN2-171 TaxID=3400909 RepID=UPI003BF7A862